MKTTDTIHSRSSRNLAEPITIRLAVPADAAALNRLAQLDSAPPPEPVRLLVAEAGDELRAALPLDGGPAIADPFERTAELVAMLAERARRLEAATPRGAAPRRRLLSASRAATVTRAFASELGRSRGG